MTDLLAAVRVIVSPHVPDDRIYVLGEFSKPEGWGEMTEEARARYAVAHGGVVVINVELAAKLHALKGTVR